MANAVTSPSFSEAPFHDGRSEGRVLVSFVYDIVALI